MSWSCNDCANLDKSKKIYNESKYCYIYGCKKGEDTTICGWCRIDSELKNMGCSFFIDKEEVKPKQMSLF